MEIMFIAGFGPIGVEPGSMVDFWAHKLGLDFQEMAPDYYHARQLPGATVFGLWPLQQAAQATFGADEWPQAYPVPQAWIEFELSSPQAVADAVEELREIGRASCRERAAEGGGGTAIKTRA